jgi:hypothetical protein
MFLTSDQALSDQSGREHEIPRHFMVISKPCNHPDTPPRDGYIRGNYESVEFIREIPLRKGLQKSMSMTNLPAHNRTRNRSASTLGREAILRNAQKNHTPPTAENGVLNPEKAATAASETDLSLPETRARGKTISYDITRSFDAKGENTDKLQQDDDCESNPIEWIMITRSDPGGSVPRFLIDRGTPGGIVSDASKFLNWACAKDLEDLESDDESMGDEDEDEKAEKREHHHNHERDLHNYQTNGHLAGIEEDPTPTNETPDPIANHQNGGGLYGMAAGLAGAAGGYIASHTPTIISDHFPTTHPTEQINGSLARRDSASSTSSASSSGSFASALENYEGESLNDGSSTKTTESAAQSRAIALRDKELQKLEEKKRKLDEKLNKAREKEISKKSEDNAKEEEAIRRAEEKHEKEVKRQEEKYKKEVEKLEKKKEREQQKAEEKKRKAIEKDEKTKLLRELEELKAEVGVLRKEKEILRGQVGDLQAENTALAARVGKLGSQGEQVLNDVRAEIGRTGRLRASSLKGLTRTTSFRSSGSSGSGEKEKENVPLRTLAQS